MADLGNEIKILPKRCPVCGIEGLYAYAMQEGNTDRRAVWYHCNCGVVFQKDFPDHTVYNEDYLKLYDGADEWGKRKVKAQFIHPAVIYAPLIEELTYGRMMLDVGFGLVYNMEYWTKRGWLTWGIEVNSAVQPKKNIYKGTFLEFDFNPRIGKEELKALTGKEKIERKFDLIWMSHVLAHFNEPLKALQRAYDLLQPDGVLYISAPDIEAIQKRGVSAFPYWRKQEHYTMWSERALKRELERLRFKIIMCRRNLTDRFSNRHDDIHLICQREWF